MAKALFICERETNKLPTEKDIKIILKELEPDNIIPNEPKIIISENSAFGVMNPNSDLNIENQGFYLGKVLNPLDSMYLPGSDFPDGSFVLYRNSSDQIEIITDIVASRTVYYYFDDSTFIASSSQRAIIMYLGNFEFNEKVIPWMLSSGNMGPFYSWDKRISHLRPNSSIKLDKTNWSIELKSSSIEFKTKKKSKESHQKSLYEVLLKTFRFYNIDFKHWTLPLSGGYDSRGILAFFTSILKDTKEINSITWGTKLAALDRNGDAYIAKKLSKKMGINHQYLNTEFSNESKETIIQRYILLSEGRIDHLAAYIDGFKIWKDLFENNVSGIIRGDEPFGCPSVNSQKNVRKMLGFRYCEDIKNLKFYTDYDIPKQEIPPFILKRKKESLPKFRDRLYQSYRQPMVLAALTGLKTSYVEVCNPLLSTEIIQTVCGMPDNLRTNKLAFKLIVDKLVTDVPIATEGANNKPEKILRQIEIVEILKAELTTVSAKQLFSEKFLKYVLEGIREGKDHIERENKFGLKKILKKILPEFIQNKIRDVHSVLDNNQLAFRVLIICRMHQILGEDKNLLQKKEN